MEDRGEHLLAKALIDADYDWDLITCRRVKIAAAIGVSQY